MSDLLSQIRAQRQNIADKKTGSRNAYRWKQKSTMVRLLPSWRDTTHSDRPFFHTFGQAFIKDLDDNLLAVIGDRRMTYGEDDAVRNLINLAMSEAATDAQREHYKNMLAKQKYLINALVLNDKDVDPSEPQIIELSQNQFDTILASMEKIVIDGENPLDFDAGYDLEVEKEGTGLMTRYKFNFARRPSKIDASVMDNATDLDAFVRSKFQDTDRAINAIKSISQSASLTVTPRPGLSYTGGDVADAEYSVVDDARDNIREPISTNDVSVSADEISKLLDNI